MSELKDYQALSSYIYPGNTSSNIARAFGVNPRTAQKWHAGKAPVPANIMHDLIQQAAEKQLEQALGFMASTNQKPSEIELYVYTSGNVLSPHVRAWSAQADKAIKEAMVPLFAEHGITAFVIER